MDIDIETIKQLSPQRKALAIVVVLALLGYFYYFFFLQAMIEKKATLSKKQEQLTQEITEKSRLAAQKDRYLKEVAQLQTNLKTVLMKLPNEREIPELFRSVSVSGKSTGIEFVLFEPQKVPKQADKDKDKKAADKKGDKKAAEKKTPETSVEQGKFYEEIPLKVTVNGGFHNTVQFFEKVANLPRIINIEDISMTGERDAKKKGFAIKTSCLMKTYMFVEKKDEKKN
jgi:type IV pilus assembly protein PilO